MERNELSRIPDRPKKNEEEKMAEYRSFKERAVPKVCFNRGDNNDLESSSSMHEQHQPNDTTIEIKQLEEILEASVKNIHEPVKLGCIYKVPRDLGNINIKAYTPQVISIGPFHHGKSWLSEMENRKLRYMLEFCTREGAEKLKEFKRFIVKKEKHIRNHYQENSSLTSPEFVNIILRDAVFIIEFFLKNAKPVEERKSDFSLDTTYMKAAITHDLQLLENQLPYFLLQSLFKKGAFHNFTKKDYPDRGGPFLSLSHLFFFGHYPKPNNEIPQYKIQHFTDLRRYFLLMDFHPRDQKLGEHVRDSPTETKLEHVRDLPTATKLYGSGVKFQCKEKTEGGSFLKISCKYESCAIPIPCIKGCKIPIPFATELQIKIRPFEIDDRSECLYRNMMAFELCHYPSQTLICNFILLMNFLINTEKDVDLLVDNEIIVNSLGDNATVATMFNRLGCQITRSPSVYHGICVKLKNHHGRRWNRTLTSLLSVYFTDIWTTYATFAAVILLVLTLIQTIFSIL